MVDDETNLKSQVKNLSDYLVEGIRNSDRTYHRTELDRRVVIEAFKDNDLGMLQFLNVHSITSKNTFPEVENTYRFLIRNKVPFTPYILDPRTITTFSEISIACGRIDMENDFGTIAYPSYHDHKNLLNLVLCSSPEDQHFILRAVKDYRITNVSDIMSMMKQLKCGIVPTVPPATYHETLVISLGESIRQAISRNIAGRPIDHEEEEEFQYEAQREVDRGDVRLLKVILSLSGSEKLNIHEFTEVFRILDSHGVVNIHKVLTPRVFEMQLQIKREMLFSSSTNQNIEKIIVHIVTAVEEDRNIIVDIIKTHNIYQIDEIEALLTEKKRLAPPLQSGAL